MNNYNRIIKMMMIKKRFLATAPPKTAGGGKKGGDAGSKIKQPQAVAKTAANKASGSAAAKAGTIALEDRLSKHDRNELIKKGIIKLDSGVKWNRDSLRTGAIAMKIGHIRLFDEWMVSHVCTILLIEDCQVISLKTKEKHGYDAIQVGAGQTKPKNTTKGIIGQFAYAKVALKKHLAEFHITKDATLPIGTSISALHFLPGQYVDVTSTSIGKGFQGVMKRFGYKGQPATHGVSVSHRSLGSTGAHQDPGKTWPGKKMAGRHGRYTKTIQNLMVHEIDPRRNLIYLRGTLAGKKGSLVQIKDSYWKKIFDLPNELKVKIPFPTFPWNRKELGAPGLPNDPLPILPTNLLEKDIEAKDIYFHPSVPKEREIKSTESLFSTEQELLNKIGITKDALIAKDYSKKGDPLLSSIV